MKKKWIVILVLILIGFLLFNIEYFTALLNNHEYDEMAKNPPLILVHGFNPVYNPRFGELSFKEMQFMLSKDLGYENRGIFIQNLSCSSVRGEKIVIRFSYFRYIGTPDIERYTKSLEEAVDIIKKCTSSERVDIVAHSMGGIVARNYINKIDNRSIRKLVMLGTPNHGGLYNGADLVDFFAEEKDNITIDFIQLSNKSEFMKELNKKEDLEGVEYYTVAGDIDGKGDGIVLKESVWLEGQEKNITVDCFHTSIKSPIRCSEAYEFVKEILKS